MWLHQYNLYFFAVVVTGTLLGGQPVINVVYLEKMVVVHLVVVVEGEVASGGEVGVEDMVVDSEGEEVEEDQIASGTCQLRNCL